MFLVHTGRTELGFGLFGTTTAWFIGVIRKLLGICASEQFKVGGGGGGGVVGVVAVEGVVAVVGEGQLLSSLSMDSWVSKPISRKSPEQSCRSKHSSASCILKQMMAGFSFKLL